MSIRTLPAPQWLKQVYHSKSGRDPLGIGSVTFGQILPELLPGINVLTFHPRYHSYYLFLLYSFWQTDQEKSPANWIAYFRPRDFFFSLSVHLPEHREDCPEHGDMKNIIGTNGTKKFAHAEEKPNSYTYQGDYIKTSLSGYSLYYRSVIATMGLLIQANDRPDLAIDCCTKPHPNGLISGEEVARAFQDTVADTRFYTDWFNRNDLATVAVPRDVLVEFADRACHCQLQHRHAQDRTLLRRCFLGRNSQRKESLRFLLDLINQSEGIPLTDDDFRLMVYFQTADIGPNKQRVTYEPRTVVRETYRHWRIFQAREYYVLALNSLLKAFCQWGTNEGGEAWPLDPSAFDRQLHRWLNIDRVTDWWQVDSPGFGLDTPLRDVLDWLRDLSIPPPDPLNDPYEYDRPLTEQKLARLIWDSTQTKYTAEQPSLLISGGILLLALLTTRLSRPILAHEPGWEMASKGADIRRPLDTFFRNMQDRADQKHTLYNVAHWLYDQYIIQQHLYIASQKLPENTFRFTREERKLRFSGLDVGLEMNASRFFPMHTTLYDLGLCKVINNGHQLTRAGHQFLDSGEGPV